MADESNFARRARTLTRVGLGAVLIGVDRAGDLLDTVANRAELPALPPGDQPAGDPDRSTVDEVRAPQPEGPSPARQLFVGAVLAGEERLVAATETAGRTAVGVGRTADRFWRLVAPEPLRAGVHRRMDELAARGRDGVDLSRDEASDAVGQIVEGVIGAEWLVDVANEAIGRLIDPILETVLPVALDKLNEDPALIQGLVRDQSLSMADQVAGQVRTGASSVDSGLERVARRLTMRRPRRELAGPPALLPDPGVALEPHEGNGTADRTG